MRRLWLLLALLVPALAAAQQAPNPAAGQITWPTVAHTNTDAYINIAECAGGYIDLTWLTSITVGGQATTGYKLYASDTAPTGDCYTTDTTVGGTAVKADLVGSFDSTRTGQMTATFATTAMVTAIGKTCANANGSTVFLCIQQVNGGTTLGVARLGSDGNPAKLTVNFDRPPSVPTNTVSARPGEGAARVSWSAGSGTSSDTFEVAAWFPAVAGTIVKRSGRITATDYRMTGLTNDQTYGISVTAFSVAGNPDSAGDPVIATSVTPSHVLDFFAMYEDAGGREQGGCSGGPAGPVALLAACVALLAVRRKQK